MQKVESWLRRSTDGLNRIANKTEREKNSLEDRGRRLLFELLEQVSGTDGVEVDTETDFPSGYFQGLPLRGHYLVTFEYSHGRTELPWSLEAHDSAMFSISPWGRPGLSETAVIVRQPFGWNLCSYPEIEIQSDRRSIKKFYPFKNGNMGEDWSETSTLEVLKLLNLVVSKKLKEQQKAPVAEQV